MQGRLNGIVSFKGLLAGGAETTQHLFLALLSFSLFSGLPWVASSSGLGWVAPRAVSTESSSTSFLSSFAGGSSLPAASGRSNGPIHRATTACMSHLFVELLSDAIVVDVMMSMHSGHPHLWTSAITNKACSCQGCLSISQCSCQHFWHHQLQWVWLTGKF